MAEAIQQFANPVDDANGNGYRAVAYGEERADGTWVGWLEFRPVHGGAPLRTGRETTQPDRGALEYWAEGLEHAYLEGALARAAA